MVSLMLQLLYLLAQSLQYTLELGEPKFWAAHGGKLKNPSPLVKDFSLPLY
jgi:hypothetical protein